MTKATPGDYPWLDLSVSSENYKAPERELDLVALSTWRVMYALHGSLPATTLAARYGLESLRLELIPGPEGELSEIVRTMVVQRMLIVGFRVHFSDLVQPPAGSLDWRVMATVSGAMIALIEDQGLIGLRLAEPPPKPYEGPPADL